MDLTKRQSFIIKLVIGITFGILLLLQLLFCVLKWTNVIAWPWYLVTIPLIIIETLCLVLLPFSVIAFLEWFFR